jgi:hypothetical protein
LPVLAIGVSEAEGGALTAAVEALRVSAAVFGRVGALREAGVVGFEPGPGLVAASRRPPDVVGRAIPALALRAGAAGALYTGSSVTASSPAGPIAYLIFSKIGRNCFIAAGFISLMMISIYPYDTRG